MRLVASWTLALVLDSHGPQTNASASSLTAPLRELGGALCTWRRWGSHPLSWLDRLCFRVSLPLLRYFLIAPQVPAGSHLTVFLMREAVGSNLQRQDDSLPLGI